MAEDMKKMNDYELALHRQLTEIMEVEKLKFSAFLTVFSNSVPAKGSDEYIKFLKKEQMKYRRSSLSVEEVFKMLEIAGWELKFTHSNNPIKPNHSIPKLRGVNYRIRFTDLMMMCEMFGIQILWSKKADRTSPPNLL